MKDYSSSQFENRPLQGSVVDLVQQNEKLNAGRREEKLEKEKFQYLKDTRERDWRENFLKENLKQQDFIDVKDADLNNLYAKTVTKAMDQAGEIAMKLAYGQGTPEDRVKLHLLNQTADKLKALNAPIGDIVTQLNNGALHEDPQLRSFLQNLGNADIDFSDKGELELLIPNGKDVKRVPYSDAMRGIDGFNLIPKVDPFKGFSEFTKDITPEEKKSYNGFETINTKGVSTELASQLAESYLYPSNKMSNALKSALKEAGHDPNNLTADAANFTLELKNKLADQLINSKERFNKKEFEYNAQQGAERNAETRRHNRVSESISQQNANTSEFSAQTSRMKANQDGISLSELTKADNVTMNAASKSFGPLYDYRSVTGGEAKVGTLLDNKKNTYEDAVILGYTYDKKSKSLVLDIEYNQGTETMDDNGNTIKGKKNRKAIKVGSATEGRVASILSGNTESLRNSIISENTKPKIDY